uniref:Uncharacterized protein n=1 Tax=Ralstonia syzygii R24 TaxID=907261 RepID=G3ACC6_9RALS|nr:hypothetical protein RALSY_mp30536 [Ralstonia syzygii R24]
MISIANGAHPRGGRCCFQRRRASFVGGHGRNRGLSTRQRGSQGSLFVFLSLTEMAAADARLGCQPLFGSDSFIEEGAG